MQNTLEDPTIMFKFPKISVEVIEGNLEDAFGSFCGYTRKILAAIIKLISFTWTYKKGMA